MAKFKLADLVPGLEGPEEFSENDSTLEVSLKGHLIRTPSGQPLTLNCTYTQQSSNRYKLTLTASSDPLFKVAGDKLYILSFHANILFKNVSATFVPDSSASDFIDVTGICEWRDLPNVLEVSGNKIPLELGYEYDPSGSSRFHLKLGSELIIEKAMMKIKEAEVMFGVLPEEDAFEIMLQGSADLLQSAKAKINAVIQPVFNKSTDQLLALPASISYYQKFHLDDGTPFGMPSFVLLPGWKDGNTPALPGLPDNIDLSLGIPRLSFTLPAFDSLPDNFDFSLGGCNLRFPQIQGLSALELKGNLALIRQGNDTKFSFHPDMSGTFEFPEILRFLFSALDWDEVFDSIGDIAGKIGEQLGLSLEEHDWVVLLKGLLPDPGGHITDLDEFADLVREKLAAMLGVASHFGWDIERIFYLIFTAFDVEEWREQIYPKLWEIWFEDSGRGYAKLPGLIWMLDNLPGRVFKHAIDFLLRTDNIDLEKLFKLIMVNGASFFETKYDSFINLFARVLSGAIDAFDPDDLAEALFSIWENLPSELDIKKPLFRQPFENLGFDLDIPDIKMPLSVMMIAQAIVGLVSSVGLELLKPLEGFPHSIAFLRHLASPVSGFLSMIDRDLCTSPAKILGLLSALIKQVEGKPVRESLILESSRYPVFGILMLIASIIRVAGKPMLGMKLFAENLDEMTGVKVKRLEAPWDYPTGNPKPIKYLVLSDVHREADSDDRGMFRFGSIDHFKDNKQMYLDILEYAKAEHYIVIEVGDCEEMWFIRDFDEFESHAKTIEKIIDDNREVYDRLRELHNMGLYVRVQGNHDSYLREQAVFDKLKAAIGSGFEIYDFVIIPGVKTMGHDFDPGGVLDDPNASPEEKARAIVNGIVNALLPVLGFDSGNWESKGQMIIAHGHQWDFWNCDEHSIVGKLFSNIFAVPADKLMDPFNDVEGIAWLGAPIFNFQEKIAGMPILSNWPAYRPAMKYAHYVQHMDDYKRLLTDDVFFFESLVAACALFGMPLDNYELKLKPNGQPDLGSDNKQKFTITKYRDVPAGITKFFDHHNNMICIGHTHIPQSRPYFDVVRYVAGSAVSELFQRLPDFLPVSINILNIQSNYFNCGTAGWMTGVVWALIIDPSGHPRLAYWTRNHREPEYMDWELHPWSEEKRDAFEQVKAQLFADIKEYLDKAVDMFGASVEELWGHLADKLSAPPHVAALAMLSEIAGENFALTHLNTTPGEELIRHVKEQSREIQEFLMKIFTAIQRKKVVDSSASALTFTISIPIESRIKDRLLEYREVFKHIPGADGDRLAAVWLCTLQNLIQMVNRMRKDYIPVRADISLLSLWKIAVLGQLFPSSGDPTAAAMDIDTEFKVDSDRLTFTVEIG